MPVPDILATIGEIRDDVERAQKTLRLALDTSDMEKREQWLYETRVALETTVTNAGIVLKVIG